MAPKEHEQSEIRDKLFGTVASSEAVLFVGAGCSISIGYPCWRDLLGELRELALRCNANLELSAGDGTLEQAQEIKKHIATHSNLDRYYQFFYQRFSKKNPPYNDFHIALLKLPFKGIMTTNYDPILDAALGSIDPDNAVDNSIVLELDANRRIAEFFMSMLSPNRHPRRVIHLHGRFDKPSSIVLTRQDYDDRYGPRRVIGGGQVEYSWPIHRKLLWAVLASRPVVFVGFSMEDEFLRDILDMVSQDLWLWDDSYHYAVMPLYDSEDEATKTRAAYIQDRFGVAVLFVAATDETDYGIKLDQLIQELAARCSVQASWLERVNDRMLR